MTVKSHLDAEILGRVLRLGGLDIPADRAAALLPVVHALLGGCDRLARLDLAASGGSGPFAEGKGTP